VNNALDHESKGRYDLIIRSFLFCLFQRKIRVHSPPGIYHTDAWNRRPLFIVNNLLVDCWEEAYALHGEPCLDDVNPAYVKSLITHESNANVSPYKLIKRIPRSHFVLNSDDKDICCYSIPPLSEWQWPS